MTEILQATDINGNNCGFYEVEKNPLTWEDRLQQIKNNSHDLVYCLFENVRTYNHGKGLVEKWESITRSSWENCRRVVCRVKTN